MPWISRLLILARTAGQIVVFFYWVLPGYSVFLTGYLLGFEVSGDGRFQYCGNITYRE